MEISWAVFKVRSLSEGPALVAGSNPSASKTRRKKQTKQKTPNTGPLLPRACPRRSRAGPPSGLPPQHPQTRTGALPDLLLLMFFKRNKKSKSFLSPAQSQANGVNKLASSPPPVAGARRASSASGAHPRALLAPGAGRLPTKS